MEAPEVPTEHLHEEMHHHATHHAKPAPVRWTMGVALTSALLAALAAVCSLLAGHYSNEAMIEQLQSSDQWAFYQAKSIKAAVLASKMELLQAEGRPTDPADKEKLATYKKEQDEIQALAKEKETLSHEYLHRHVIFARGVTLFQVAIAVGAISVLTARKEFWWISLIFGLVGVFFLAQGLLAH